MSVETLLPDDQFGHSMRGRINFISLALTLPLLAVALVVHVSQLSSQTPEGNDKFDQALQSHLEQLPEESARFIVHLEGSADLQANLPQSQNERRAAIVRRLQETAATRQHALILTLEKLQANGDVARIRPLWIINAVMVESRPHVPYVIAQRPDVARLTLDARQQYVKPPSELSSGDTQADHWNIVKVRATHVWRGLGVTGQGVTLGIMDTGVDWTHPDLHVNYRGLQNNGVIEHEGNWFDAVSTEQSYDEPFDPNGHGTHVTGIATGAGGIGVAPDARWIAVRAFDSNGYANISDLHVAFQWLLAPAGRPELAPDIVNGSWSGSGQDTIFTADLYALHQAGIVTVFAAGNAGPYEGSIGSPASYSGAIAVAAMDDREEVAWFSGRGPSPLTNNPKPEIAAPGARIYSTLPGGSYGAYNGTSMAAPHVSGAAALLLSANPALDSHQLTRVLTETAHHSNTAAPDNHQGWGQIDVYAAVAGQMMKGILEGVVTDGVAPVSGAIVTVTTSTGEPLRFETDSEGRYTAWLRPGVYGIQGTRYGYFAGTPQAVTVPTGSTVHYDLVLDRQPHSTIKGRVLVAGSGIPLSAAHVIVTGVPVSATTDVQGVYTLTLPSGHDYTLRAKHNGFRLSSVMLALEANTTLSHDFHLQGTQSILLVDSGHWYYDSQAHFYRQALLELGYAYDEWKIYAPGDTPSYETLSQYDVVIWTAPQDAPGWIGGGGALAAYLNAGGNLLISGQYVAQRDGVNPLAYSWFTQFLEARYVGNATEPYTLTGVSGTPFAGAQFALNTDDSAANQLAPARVAPQPGSLTRSVLNYPGDLEDAGGALIAGWCQPYRIVFLAFGLEGAGPAHVRAELLGHSLDYFEAPITSRALSIDPKQINEVVLPGQALTMAFNLQNLSEVQTSTIDLEYESAWPASLSQPSVELGPCQQQPVTLTLQVPAQLAPGSRQDIELTARAAFGAVAGASIVTSSPAPYLLVADYRWYDETQAYRIALHGLDVQYDTWDTNVRGSPSLQRLQAYHALLWYTGYDWHRPLTEDEISMLRAYMDGGGRLFLSSQDYLYYHRKNAFTYQYLGIGDYLETMTTTAVLGGDNALAGDGVGPLSLTFDAYRNFADGLAPAPSGAIHSWNQQGIAAGVATHGSPWRSIFWGVPLELLAADGRGYMLGNIMGWLGDLGDSTLEVGPRVASASATRNYTLTIRNWQHARPNRVAMTTTWSADLILDPLSISGGATFDANKARLLWHGEIAPGGSHQIVFQAHVNVGTVIDRRIDLTTTMAYSEPLRMWQQIAPTWIDGPDLSKSFLAVEPVPVRPDSFVTYTAYLHNGATVAGENLSATLTLPYGLRLVTDTLHASDGTVTLHDRYIAWKGAIGSNDAVSITVAVHPTGLTEERLLPAGLVLSDGISSPTVRNGMLHVVPYQQILPLFQR